MKLEVQIPAQRVARAREVHLHTVIDNQVHGDQRLDHLSVLAHAIHGAAHGGEVHEKRHAREVLENNSRHHKRDLILAWDLRIPASQILHVLLRHLFSIAIPRQCLQHDADGNRQPTQIRGDPRLLKCREGAEVALFARACRESAERVHL